MRATSVRGNAKSKTALATPEAVREVSEGRINALRRLGVNERSLGIATTGLGAWAVARSRALHQALKTSTLDRYGFVVPWDFAGART